MPDTRGVHDSDGPGTVAPKSPARLAYADELLGQDNYRGQWYSSGDAHGSYFGLGIHGQHLWIDPTARVVVAKLSSRPEPVDEGASALTFAAFRAVAAALKDST